MRLNYLDDVRLLADNSNIKDLCLQSDHCHSHGLNGYATWSHSKWLTILLDRLFSILCWEILCTSQIMDDWPIHEDDHVILFDFLDDLCVKASVTYIPWHRLPWKDIGWWDIARYMRQSKPYKVVTRRYRSINSQPIWGKRCAIHENLSKYR